MGDPFFVGELDAEGDQGPTFNVYALTMLRRRNYPPRISPNFKAPRKRNPNELIDQVV